VHFPAARRPGDRKIQNSFAQKSPGPADSLVSVLIRVIVAPLKIIFLFSTSRFRKITISLMVVGHVLMVGLVFMLVPLVVVTSIFVVIPLTLVI